VRHILADFGFEFAIGLAFPFTPSQSALLGLWLAFGWLVFAWRGLRD